MTPAGAQVVSLYHGSYDGGCQDTPGNWAGGLWKRADKLGFNQKESNHDQAKANCNSMPDCMGYGSHYSIDKYFIASATVKSLYCQDPANNRCGQNSPTNGCYVRFNAATNAPYVATTMVPRVRIKAQSANKWLEDGMNSFASGSWESTVWEVIRHPTDNTKIAFKALAQTSNYDGKYMQATCGEKQKTPWADTISDDSYWTVADVTDWTFTTTQTGLSLANKRGEWACSNIHHTTPPTCSYSCKQTWTFDVAIPR